MSLESYSTEARSMVADFLICSLRHPEHWYSPMLPPEHPSSLGKLAGWTLEEHNLVLEAADLWSCAATSNSSASKTKCLTPSSQSIRSYSLLNQRTIPQRS